MSFNRENIKLILRIIIPIVLIIFIVRLVSRDWISFKQAIQQASISLLFISQLCFIGGTLTIALAWQRLLILLGADISLAGALRSFFYSILGKYIPGKIWGATGRIYVAHREGVPELTSTLGVLLETVLLIVSSGVIGGVAITQWQGQIPWQVRFAAFLAPFNLLFLHPRVIQIIIPFLSRKFPGRISVLEHIPRFTDMLMIALVYCSIWVWWGAGYFFAMKSIAMIEIDQFVPFIGGNTLAWLTGFIAVITPAGLGVRELVLTSLTVGSVGTGAAVLAAVLSRIFTLISEILGTITMWIFQKSR